MNFSTAARRLLLASPLLAANSNVAAFSAVGRLPSTFVGRTATSSARAFTSSATSLQMANVLKLTDPQSQLLDEVDVFIFDCDGVIWRVRYFRCYSAQMTIFCFACVIILGLISTFFLIKYFDNVLNLK